MRTLKAILHSHPVHVSSIIKREASGDWEIRSSVVFKIGSFAKQVYMYIIFVVLIVVCILFCVVQQKKGVETRVVITERAGQTKSVSYLCFPLISDER